jgi:23S rRNA (cytosine1962-C5)-methyltransferase
LLSGSPQFVLLTAYAVKASSITLRAALDEEMSSFHGETRAGEVVLVERSAGRFLSMAVYACWSRFEKKKQPPREK